MSGFLIDAQGPFIQSAPDDDRDYSISWVNVLALLGPSPPDTIATSAWNVPPGVTIGTTLSAAGINTAWLTTPGGIGEYYVSNTITTAGGRNFTRGFRLIVTENI